MFTDIYMPPCIWVDEIQFAAWCIGAELQTDLTFWELINWLVGWILHKESGARWTVPRFKFYMCTGVVNVSSTAWLGMAFISMLSERTTNLKAMSPKQLKYCSMDVKPKYKQSCTYTLAGTCNKAENFQWILWTRQSAEWENLYPRPVLSPFWEAHDLDRKGQAPVQGSC